MNNRPPLSACEELERILGKIIKSDNMSNLSISNESNTREILELNRASLACEKNMIVSPLSNNKSTLFVTPKKYQEHLDKKEKMDAEKKAKKDIKWDESEHCSRNGLSYFFPGSEMKP